MSLELFLQKIKQQVAVSFDETLAVIDDYYHYRPTSFRNGVHEPLINEAGKNEGSCRIFAFAQLHQLTPEQTLSLFGDYYRVDVLAHPDGNDHQNIRVFMRDGWAGIQFDDEALTPRLPQRHCSC